jgi:hypothetical protein
MIKKKIIAAHRRSDIRVRRLSLGDGLIVAGNCDHDIAS